MDKISNTCGRYDGFYPGQRDRRPIQLCFPTPLVTKPGNTCLNKDVSDIADGKFQCDVVYLDPPYNSRQYSHQYHLLENVARWRKPPVAGKGRQMDVSDLNSKFCTKEALQYFESLVKGLRNCRHIVVSYNNI